MTGTPIEIRPEDVPPEAPPTRSAAAWWALLGAAILWAEWPALAEMAQRWRFDARYSHGFVVPILAGYLVWRQGRPEFRPGRSAAAAAIGLFLAGAALKVLGSAIFLSWLDAAALMPWLAGLALLVGGWPLLGRTWPAIAFLVFMIPLPYRVEVALGAPMQRLATDASTYLLQTIGLPATAEGTVIALDDARTIAVVEACNGLGMLFTFACYATAAALLIRRPAVDRLILLAGAAPLALGANILRITSTGLMHRYSGNHAADVLFHDVAGWLMMPVALLAFWGELKLLDLIFVEADGSAARPGVFLGPGVAPLHGRSSQLQGDPR